MNIFTQFFKGSSTEQRKQAILQDLMRREAALTREIFGPVPLNGRREFFCLDKHTWVWFEEWVDEQGHKKQVTTRYLIRSKEVLKSQNGGAYYRSTIKEAHNFLKATKRYQEIVNERLYRQPELLRK